MDDESSPTKKQSWWSKLVSFFVAVPELIREEIWDVSYVNDKSVRAYFFGLLRIIALTVDGVENNRIPSQAAALSYFTLVAVGPFIAIVIMVSGFILPDDGRDRIAEALTNAVYFVAPSAETASEREVKILQEHSQLHSTTGKATSESGSEEKIKSELETVIDGLVENARSSTFGVIGSILLILISVQLLATIEKNFNAIWGVLRGRKYVQRFVFYWTFISLGAVLGVAVLTIGIYSKIAEAFKNIPHGEMFRDSVLSLSPLFIFIIVLLLLTIFNRFIPNIRVRWGPALLGSLVVTLLLYLNQALSFFYIGFVIRQQSLFGAVGILPVLLLGLFIFWLILLLGGQLTYSIQNVNHLTHLRAWNNTSRRAQELLALATLAIVGRRFEACEEPLTADELSERIRVPVNILNHTIWQLTKMGMLTVVDTETDRDDDAPCYQPGRPLDRVSLADFKYSLESQGNNEALMLLEQADPAVQAYADTVLEFADSHPAQITMKALLNERPKSSGGRASDDSSQ
ncbi:MAG: YihY/virulence factor BrkB family protein [Verrucomicrobiota bacterium]